MDIPTVKDQVEASQPEKKAPPKPKEETVKEKIAKAVSKITVREPTVKCSFVGSVPNDAIDSLVAAGYDVDYSCSYVMVDGNVSVASALRITNPVFKSRKEKEERDSKKEFSDAMGRLIKNLSVQANPDERQYYDLFSAFVNGV